MFRGFRCGTPRRLYARRRASRAREARNSAPEKPPEFRAGKHGR